MYLIIILVIIFIFFIYNIKEKKPKEIITINKIYYINLESSLERKKNILLQAKKEKLILERFPAINGKILDINKLYKNKLFTKFIFTSKRGMIGCTLSHINLWKKIAKSYDENILILEDDVIFVKNFKNKFISYMKQVPENWDIIYLGASNIYGRKINNNIIKPLYNSGHLTNVGAYAMLVKKKTVIDLLKIMEPVDNDFDVQIKNKYNKYHNIYYFNPPLILHNNNINSDRRVIDGSSPKSHVLWRNKIQTQIKIV
jgi:GR25 family glycosyltransferase involved in LPS biosynthesis